MARSVLVLAAILALAFPGLACAASPAYVAKVDVTNDGASVFSDDFASGRLDNWTEVAGAGVIQWNQSDSGHCLRLQGTGDPQASLSHACSIIDSGTVELSAQVWLPKLKEGEHSIAFKLYLRSGTIIEPFGKYDSVFLSADWYKDGYSINAHWTGPGAPCEVCAGTKGPVLKPETWATVTLRLNESTGALVALLDGKEQASTRVKPEDFKSIAGVTVMVSPLTRIVGANPLDPPTWGSPGPAPSVSMIRDGTKGGFYVDDFLVTSGGKTIFFDDFQTGNLDLWDQTQRIHTRVKCTGSSCCMILNRVTRTSGSALRPINISNPTVVEVSGWVWLPPADEQSSGGFTGLQLYSGAPSAAVLAGVRVHTDKGNYRLCMISNASHKCDDPEGSVLPAGKWFRLTLRLDIPARAATALVDGKPELSVSINDRDYPSITNAAVYGWFGDKTKAD